MSIFVKATAIVLITLVLCLVLSKQGKDFSLLVTIAACSIIAITAFQYLTPIFDFFQNLKMSANINPDMFSIIIKAVGIAMISEITGVICKDAGNASLGKMLQILGSAVILWISIPLFNSLLTLVEDILIAI